MTKMVTTFANFLPLSLVLVVMLGIDVAEQAGIDPENYSSHAWRVCRIGRL
jgi:p-aminobenzoyl-glutamate transporter AbgT